MSEWTNMLDFAKLYDTNFNSNPNNQPRQPSNWVDDVVINKFLTIKPPNITVHGKISRLKSFFMYYSGTLQPEINISNLFCQILAGGKHFRDSSTNLFKFNAESGSKKLAPWTDVSDIEDRFKSFCSKPANLFYRNICTAFKALSVEGADLENGKLADILHSIECTAIFLILLMYRRIVKSESDLLAVYGNPKIHKQYNDMCPSPFESTLPVMSSKLNQILQPSLSITGRGRDLGTLIFYLYQTTTDTETTETEAILKAACMNQLSGTGLQLVTLFSQVKQLYEKTEYDMFRMLGYQIFFHSLRRISLLRIKQSTDPQTKTKKVNSVRLFSFCRIMNQNYHSDLGYKGNEHLCYILACLIDLKSAPRERSGGAKQAMWTARLDELSKRQMEGIALTIQGMEANTSTANHRSY